MANIRTSRKSGFITRGGVSRRESLWLGGVFSLITISAPPGPVIVSSLSAFLLGLRPFTVVRNRGIVGIHTDQIAATEHIRGAYGAAVVSDQAVAIGVTAVPTPVTDSESDLWFTYQMLQASFDFADATGFTATEQQYQVDSKAMRKVEDGQDLIEVVELAGTSGGAIIQTQTRMLIKLH